ALGAHGAQVAPPPPPGAPPPTPSPPGPFGINLSGPFQDVWNAILGVNLVTFPDAIPYWMVIVPDLLPELTDALGPSDGTVRVAISRMDQAPFLGHDFYATFE